MKYGIFLFLFILNSCATLFQEGYFTSKNKFSENEYVHYGIKYANYFTGGVIYFDFYAANSKETIKTFFLKVVDNKSQWNFINIISFKINSEIYSFNVIDSERKLRDDNSIMETDIFLLKNDFLSKFLSTNLVEVRLEGSYIIDLKIESSELNGLQIYLKREL